MNRRNLHVEVDNPRDAVRLVNDKYRTKAALRAVGVPASPTIATVRHRADLVNFDWESLPDTWALKPNHGRGGAGIMLAARREREGWETASGGSLGREAVARHISYILDGDYSMEGMQRDWALFEPLIVPHPTLAVLSGSGLADVRVICCHQEPVLSMMRLPTLASGGRANLHQGAIGAAVDLTSGRLTRARHRGRDVSAHPDTGKTLIGVEVPCWEKVLDAAAACGDATGLGYLGTDIVIDRERGPLVLEVNARPGLEIQNVTGVGLLGLL
jgi:alpha-L-glutamate ligase-like protein